MYCTANLLISISPQLTPPRSPQCNTVIPNPPHHITTHLKLNRSSPFLALMTSPSLPHHSGCPLLISTLTLYVGRSVIHPTPADRVSLSPSSPIHPSTSSSPSLPLPSSCLRPSPPFPPNKIPSCTDLLVAAVTRVDARLLMHGPLWKVERRKPRAELVVYDVFCLVFLNRPPPHSLPPSPPQSPPCCTPAQMALHPAFDEPWHVRTGV